jgi:hypothetical protein
LFLVEAIMLTIGASFNSFRRNAAYTLEYMALLCTIARPMSACVTGFESQVRGCSRNGALVVTSRFGMSCPTVDGVDGRPIQSSPEFSMPSAAPRTAASPVRCHGCQMTAKRLQACSGSNARRKEPPIRAIAHRGSSADLHIQNLSSLHNYCASHNSCANRKFFMRRAEREVAFLHSAIVCKI